MSKPKLTREEALTLAWERGLLDFLLDVNQKGLNKWLAETEALLVVLDASRQLGKSYWLCVLAIQSALRNPGWQIKYAAPTAKMVRKIIRPHFRKILASCPKHLRPVFHTQEGEYRFPNGSVVTVAGTDRDNIDNLRGQHAHLAIVDEAGFMDDLVYVVKSVLLPQTTNTDGRILIASTPAKSPGHSFKEFCDQAAAMEGRKEVFMGPDENGDTIEVGRDEGAFAHRTIYCNPRLNAARIRRLQDSVGGKDTTDWQREYMGLHVTDANSAVFKRATDWRMRKAILQTAADGRIFWEAEDGERFYQPKYRFPIVALDPGHTDLFGFVFGEWWEEHAIFACLRAFSLRAPRTPEIADAIRRTERELWPTSHDMPYAKAKRSRDGLSWAPLKRVSDIDPRMCADLSADYGILVFPTRKDDRDTAINTADIMLAGEKGRTVFDRDGTRELRKHLQNAIWNKARTQWERSETDGHFDVASAYVYAARNLPRGQSPVPEGMRPDGQPMRAAGRVIVPGERTNDATNLASRLSGLMGLGRRP